MALKSMRIRTSLMLSYVTIILVTIVSTAVVTSVILTTIINEVRSISLQQVSSIAEINEKLSESVLSHFGEMLVEAQANTAITQLSWMLKGRSHDYDVLRRDDAIRAIATQDIQIDDRKAGYMDVLDSKGISILHPNKDVEGRNFDEWKEQFPDMWELVERSFTEDHVSGYYSFLDKDNNERRKFMVLRHIPGTSFILVGAVNIDAYFLPIHDKIEAEADTHMSRIEEGFEAATGHMKTRLFIIGALVDLIVLLISLGFGIWFSRRISRPVLGIRDRVESMSKGDFSGELVLRGSTEQRQLAAAFNEMKRHLQSLLVEVKRSVISLISMSTEISANAIRQQENVNSLGSSTNQVVAASRQISTTSQELVHTMSEVADSANDTAGLAGTGRDDLMRMDSTMRELMDASVSISDKLAIINEHTENINTITTTISKVAEKTNLLSLNAAIEAEKAGEYGKGFSVVAREIRRLADQTAVATMDIGKMIKEMYNSVSSGVMEMEKFMHRVRSGAEDVQGIIGKMERIIEKVQRLTPRFEEVEKQIQMQSEGAGQISTAMSDLNQTAFKTSDSIADFEKTTQQLKAAAASLQQELKYFRGIEAGEDE